MECWRRGQTGKRCAGERRIKTDVKRGWEREDEMRESKQKNYCKWGSVSNTAGPAEAINTDLTHTYFSDCWRLLYKHVRTHTCARTHILYLIAVKSRKEHSTNFIQHGRTPNLPLHKGANRHKVQSSKVVSSVQQISFISPANLQPAALTAVTWKVLQC